MMGGQKIDLITANTWQNTPQLDVQSSGNSPIWVRGLFTIAYIFG